MELQDEIVGRLSRSIGIELVRSDAARAGSDAIDLVMRARALLYDAKRRESTSAAIDLFRQVLEAEPNCVDALIGIAQANTYQVIDLGCFFGRDCKGRSPIR